MTSLKNLQIMEFPKIVDFRGNLSFIEGGKHIPFIIGSTRWIYDVPGGESFDSYATMKSEEVIISLSGSFDIVVNDGEKESQFTFNRSNIGIYVPKLIWRTLKNFSTNTLILILATNNDPNENIYKYNEFLLLKTEHEY